MDSHAAATEQGCRALLAACITDGIVSLRELAAGVLPVAAKSHGAVERRAYVARCIAWARRPAYGSGAYASLGSGMAALGMDPDAAVEMAEPLCVAVEALWLPARAHAPVPTPTVAPALRRRPGRGRQPAKPRQQRISLRQPAEPASAPEPREYPMLRALVEDMWRYGVMQRSVAAVAGVSRCVVSRALAGHPVRTSMRSRVVAAAETLIAQAARAQLTAADAEGGQP